MEKQEIKKVFNQKRIIQLGLGLLGRGVGDAAFLAKYGAKLTVTDSKTSEQLSVSVKKLKSYKNIEFVLGEHRLSDFKNKDLILKAAGVPLDSPYILEAKKNKIPVEMDASLFAKHTKATLVGITGTRGKSTTSYLIHHILKLAGKKVFLAGNIKGMATLPLLEKVKERDIVVLELDSWQLQGFGDSKISPKVAVFTTFYPDHLNYYKGSMKDYFSDKANIFLYQSKNDHLVAPLNILKEVKLYGFGKKVKSNFIVANSKKVAKLTTKLLGDHNLINIACAAEACKVLGVNEAVIKKGIKTFSGIPGRQEYLGCFKGINFYNDTNSTTPDAVAAAVNVIKKRYGLNKLILIAGGANKSLDYKKTSKLFNNGLKKVILFKGAATDLILQNKSLAEKAFIAESMKEALKQALLLAKKGDVVMLSPGAASFGIFKNEYDRGDQFVRAVRVFAKR